MTSSMIPAWMMEATSTNLASLAEPVQPLSIARTQAKVSTIVAPFMLAALLVGAPSTSTTVPVNMRDENNVEKAGGWIVPQVPPDIATRVEGTASNDLATAVRSLRDETGLTWDQLGKLFGVSRRAVHHWSSGGRMTVRHAELLGELTRQIRDLDASTPQGRRQLLLAPGGNGYSKFDQLRIKVMEEQDWVSGSPFGPAELVGTTKTGEARD